MSIFCPPQMSHYFHFQWPPDQIQFQANFKSELSKPDMKLNNMTQNVGPKWSPYVQNMPNNNRQQLF